LTLPEQKVGWGKAQDPVQKAIERVGSSRDLDSDALSLPIDGCFYLALVVIIIPPIVFSNHTLAYLSAPLESAASFSSQFAQVARWIPGRKA